MDEMNITSFSSLLSQTFFLAWRWIMLFLHCVLQCFMFFSEMVWSIKVPFSWRKNLTFVGAETGKFYISHGWLKLCRTYQPFEVRFLLFCCFCSEVEHVIIDWRTMDEMKNAPFSSHVHKAVCRSERTIGFLTVQSQSVEDRVKTRVFMNIISGCPHPPHPPICKLQRNLQRSNIFQHSSSSNALHMTLSHPPTPPHPPICKQQRNLQRSNIFQHSSSSNALHMTLSHPPHPPHPPICKQQRNLQRSNIFQHSSSSNALHMTLSHLPPPPPPPHLYTRTTFLYRVKTEGSSELRGTPSLDPIYIYIYVSWWLNLKLIGFIPGTPKPGKACRLHS